jgi:hypothetical protein
MIVLLQKNSPEDIKVQSWQFSGFRFQFACGFKEGQRNVSVNVKIIFCGVYLCGRLVKKIKDQPE